MDTIEREVIRRNALFQAWEETNHAASAHWVMATIREGRYQVLFFYLRCDCGASDEAHVFLDARSPSQSFPKLDSTERQVLSCCEHAQVMTQEPPEEVKAIRDLLLGTGAFDQ